MPYQRSTIEHISITCPNIAIYLCDMELMKIGYGDFMV